MNETFEQLNREVQELKAWKSSLERSSSIPLNIDQAFKGRFGRFLFASKVIDFGLVNSLNANDQTITVAGAVPGDPVALGMSNSNPTSLGIFTARVSAADTVSVRLDNASSSSIDPPSQTFTVVVFKQS